VPGQTELGLAAVALARQPGLGVGGREVGLVRAPLASEVDLLVATAAAGGGRSATAPTSFRLPLATQVGLGLEALERSPGLEQGAVDGEVIVGEQVLLASLPQHGLEEGPGDVVVEQPAPVLGEAGVVEGVLAHIEAQEPLEEEVVLEPLAELTLAPNRVERHQQAALEQVLGRNRRPALGCIHGVEGWRQALESLINHWANAPDRMQGGDEFVGRYRAQHGELALCGTAHAGGLQDVSRTEVGSSCRQLTASRAHAHVREGSSTPC
jgi:hypothetical protein